MISTDTFFSASITIAIFYLTSLFSLIIEHKKNSSFRIRLLILAISIISLLLFSGALFLHLYSLASIKTFVKSFQLFFSSFSLFPFGRAAFTFDGFIKYYLAGVIAFLPLAWAGIADAITSKFLGFLERIYDIVITIFSSLWIPYVIGYIIYSYLPKIPMLFTFIVILLTNFICSFLIFLFIFIGFLIFDFLENVFTGKSNNNYPK